MKIRNNDLHFIGSDFNSKLVNIHKFGRRAGKSVNFVVLLSAAGAQRGITGTGGAQDVE